MTSQSAVKAAKGVKRAVRRRPKGRSVAAPGDMLHSIVESLPSRIFWKDLESRYLGCNTAFARDAGFAGESEIVGKTDFEMGWREEAESYRRHDRAVMASGIPELAFEEPQTTPEGGTRWLSTSKVPFRGPDGNVLGIVGVYEDITKRKRADEALSASEERHRTILQTAMDGFWLVDRDGRLLDVNEAYCRMSGYTAAELLTMGVPDLSLVETRDTVRARIKALMEKGSERFESTHRRKDGTRFTVEASVQYLPFEGGRLVAFLRDVTEQRQAAAALRQSHDMIAKLTAQVPGVVYQYRLYPDGRSCFPFASPGAWNIYEVTPEAVREDATPAFARLHPDDRDRVSALIFESARTLEPFHCEFRVVLPRQGLCWRLCDAMPERMEDGGTLWHGIISDITERKQADEVLRLSLKEKESLLREVHHRVKNNLQVITSLLRLETSRSEAVETKRVLRDMQGRILSMAVLHETLYRTGRFGQVELGSYLRQLAQQLFRAASSSARLDLDLPPVAVEIDQAIPCGLIVNELLTNSLKHAFAGGSGGEVRLSLGQDDLGEVRIAVADTGVGLPADFEMKRGRSLGLQLVTDLVRQIGGRLDIEGGSGAGFVVTFTPATPPATTTLSPGGANGE